MVTGVGPLTKMELLKDFVWKNIAAHHINSFDHLLHFGLQEIVNREPPVCGIKFGAVYVEKPVFTDISRRVQPMYPNQARKRNETYEGVVCVNVTYNSRETRRVPIGKIPIMLMSSACNLSQTNLAANEECTKEVGGYFIIKGRERVLVSQLRPCYNRVYTFESKPAEKFCYISEQRSMNESGLSVLVKAMVDERYTCVFSLPYIKTTLPAGLVFRALGIDEIDKIIKWVGCNSKAFATTLRAQFNEAATQTEAIASIALKLPNECDGDPIDYVTGILTKELFYHIGPLTPLKSALHLAYILKRLMATATGSLKPDDKYSLSNKRLDTSGNLVGFIFNGLFKQFVKSLYNQVHEKKVSDPVHVIRAINNINYGMSSCFMSSNWTTQKSTNTYSRVGVSQVLSVQNFGAKLSHLKRVMLPHGLKGKNSAARLLHSSHFGFFCPYETPEGERVGLVTNMALCASVTVGIPPYEIHRCGVLDDLAEAGSAEHWVLLNGQVVGSCSDPASFKARFNEYRSRNLIDSKVSLVWQRYANELHILCDEGRMFRPLYAVDSSNGFSVPESFQQGLDSGAIVFRDVEELEQAVVAMDSSDLQRNRCEYLELCPAATMMSVMASVIPFSNHSQSPRNAYQSSMGKQALGIPSEAYRFRYDTTLHVLHYPQKPITRSEVVNVLKFNEMCHGSLPIVAIMTFNGFNQEDSLILNKASLERGLFSAMTYSTIVEEERKRGNTDYETVCLPKLQYRRHDVNYSHLTDSGVVANNSTLYLRAGDAIVGKTRVKTTKNAEGVKTTKTFDATVTIKPGEEGYVDSVIDVVNSEGIRVIKIRLRKLRFPEIGDKFASSCAQKGTCGMIYAQEDMPFDADGICPDVIINPHAIPSRMTINMLIEQTLNLVGCRSGKLQDATAFAHPNITEELAAKLVANGFVDCNGSPRYKSTLYSGATGLKYPAKIFIAPAYYQRLRHIVSDKIHARMAGPVDAVTRIPVAGRSHGGGLRFGGMEIDATIASGAAAILKDLMYEQADRYLLPVCSGCGQVPLAQNHCKNCEQEGSVSNKITPYATKLFYQLLQGHGIKLVIK